MQNEDQLKTTYYLKNTTACPVCGREFIREELLSGRGRLIAGKLTDELRRLYEPSKKYGKINPLKYPITVCPDCLYAVFHDDFEKIPEKNLDSAQSNADKRIQLVLQTFGPLDFDQPRDEKKGIASYFLALNCYSFMDKGVAPTVKKGICALRAAWMLGDLEAEEKKGNYGYIQNIMYRNAKHFYETSMSNIQTGQESLDGIKLGPDTDKNWGYEGFLYIVSILQFKMGFLEKDLEKRAKKYIVTKRVISKLFGTGKSSKSKPSMILDMAHDLYDKISQYIKEIEAELGKKLI